MQERLKIQRQKTTTPTYTQPNLAQNKQNFSLGAAQTQITTEQGHDISRISLRPQARLTVSQPGDAYEQEADRVADQVMRMEAPASQEPLQGAVVSQQDSIQMKPSLQLAAENQCQASDDIESQLSSSKGGGSPLPDNVRSFMEPRFGTQFDNVRVHTDSKAVQMNQDLGAQAFTYGSDIYFGEGKFAGNNELTAHELTHVVQQTGVEASNLATDRIHRVSNSSVNPAQNSTNSPTPEAEPSSLEVPPELAGKTIQISIELPPPAPIEVPLEDIEPSPEYIDILDKPLSDSDTVMAKLLPGIIQRDGNDKSGIGIDVEANSFSFTATALYRNSNLYTFNNLLGRGNYLEIGFIPQFQWSYDGQKAAYQIGIPMLNQHFQLFKGNVISELEAGISSVLTTSSVGGQAQLQLHLLKFGEISVLGTGSLTYTREGGTGKLEPDGNIGTQISITF